MFPFDICFVLWAKANSELAECVDAFSAPINFKGIFSLPPNCQFPRLIHKAGLTLPGSHST